jgi:hypothetical protein
VDEEEEPVKELKGSREEGISPSEFSCTAPPGMLVFSHAVSPGERYAGTPSVPTASTWFGDPIGNRCGVPPTALEYIISPTWVMGFTMFAAVAVVPS